jgi:hypothetical protein
MEFAPLNLPYIKWIAFKMIAVLLPLTENLDSW